MEKYTLENLKALNGRYDYNHGLKESDVVNVNNWVELIEKSRCSTTPLVGDIVEFTNKYGNYYQNAHIDNIEGEELYICETPYVPFIMRSLEGVGYCTSTSGGAWTYIPKKLKLIGTRKKLFKDWGSYGVCAEGAVTFYAEVNVWEYIDGNPEFTTKEFDKHYVSITKDRVHSTEYKYIIRKESLGQVAFRTDEEYKAWLKTFHGVEQTGYGGINQRIVWTYKQSSRCVPLNEYQSITDAVIDSELCNGTIQECKRIYKGTSVETILPYQNNKINLLNTKRYMRAYGIK